MPEGVVVDFELVDVHHADGEGDVQPHGVLPPLQADGVVVPPVCHAGELVQGGLPLDLGAVLIQLDVGVDPGLDHQGVEGLGDIVHSPQGQPALLVLKIGEACDENDGDVLGGGVLLQQRQHLKAVDAGHNHVQKDQRVVAALGVVQPALGGVNRGDIIGVIQNRLQKISLNRAVVDNQNSLHGDAPLL